MYYQSPIDYILKLLCPELSSDIQRYVSYERNVSSSKSLVVIKRSFFFDGDVYGNKKTLPSVPLRELEGIPILFGEPRIEKNDGKVILYADIIASSFFLITRYEEIARPDCRDIHGRFPGRESLPFRAGFINRPLVDEYGKLLRKCLRMAGVQVEEPKSHFSHIFLTHDVDIPWTKYSFAGAFKRVGGELLHRKRIIIHPFLNLIGQPERDPYYSFETLISINKQIADAESVFFLKSGGNIKPEDAEPYIHDKGFHRLNALLEKANATIGYHVSYEASKSTYKIREELKTLRQATMKEIHYSRNHYLASREPSDFNELIKNGITDDFTMSYADVAGFRLGTCRPVRWIDPLRGVVTDLTLHPLTIMDCTLTARNYMGLDESMSQTYGDTLINHVYENGGEVTLLLHNNAGNGNIETIDWRNYLHFVEKIKEKH